jgi:asparagine synthase (glutamine-hydrolysing)
MCGIAGIIPFGSLRSENLVEKAQSMVKSLAHRGPDAHGVWVDGDCRLVLAHTRLSILDLSPTGAQPMTSSSGRYHIVFNGEIYNFQVLSNELKKLGRCFKGHSDTEVVLEAVEEWGIEQTLRRCRGMFAMAIWDAQDRELLLCRDRMGEKPLFFGWVENSFVFASELKAITKIFSHSLTIDKSALTAFFRFGYVPTPYSIYTSIFKLQPGTFLRFPLSSFPSCDDFSPYSEGNAVSPKPYWQLHSVAYGGQKNLFDNDNAAIEQFDQLLRETVALQRIADVPVGAFLSGGIDSSLVSAVMQAVSGQPIQTFTIGFKEKEFDEAPYARAIAKHIGSDHHEHYISANDGLGLIESLPFSWDEPFADASQIPSLLVAQIARKKVTVCLTGDGGDELFCGYNRYFLSQQLWEKQTKVPSVLRSLTSRGLTRVSPGLWQAAYRLYKRLALNKNTQANFGLKVYKFAELLRMKSQPEAYRYLLSYWKNPAELLNDIQEASSILDLETDPQLGSFIHTAMYWDQLGYLVDDNLVKGDRASMACSLETRLPLLDHKIVEFSWHLPLSMKLRDRQSKWLLRQVLYRYVPKSLIERPKMGFSVPIGEWLRGPLRDWAGDLISSLASNDSVVLNQQVIQKVWSEHQKNTYDHSNKLWTLLMWQAWYKHWREGG